MTALFVAEPVRRRIVGALAALAVAVSTFAVAAATPAQASARTDESGFAASINASRTKAGRPAYAVSGDLSAVAHRWAVSMASGASLRHNPNLAGQISGWRFVGENVGVGSDVGELHQAFMNSPAHRANIMDADFTQVGIGVAYGGGRLWVTEVFRRPTVTAPAAALRPVTRAKAGARAKPSARSAPVYRIGSRGTVVKRIQRRVGVRADGRYGRYTSTSVKRWQRAHNIKPTGVVNAALLRAMRA